MVRWVLEWTPQDFGFVRSRWCCGVIVWLLLEIYELQVSAETVRRWLHREPDLSGILCLSPVDK